MSQYAQLADMREAFGDEELILVTTPEGQPRETIDTSRVNTELVTASAEIDSYLRQRYQMPINGTDPMIARVCCDIARWRLWNRSDAEPSNAVRGGYKDAIAWLKSVNVGSVTLDGEIAINVGTDFSNFVARRPAFMGRCS
ncbi:DUF1320 family protein [Komagataeibacter kakiaceti JCM 25156]|uniref:gp436 family protein n=1 Tax=Komagataeibacter kakiaceti TaxID=943261 RepID=UPI00047250F8|nr:DUF1320 domain-containing protein [Komagataeibacter kakiaceti]